MTLTLREFHRSSAVRVIVGGVVNPGAHRDNNASSEGHQVSTSRTLHPYLSFRDQATVVTVRVEDDRHAVVDGSRHSGGGESPRT